MAFTGFRYPKACKITEANGVETLGTGNKMFVRADLMPHLIEITGIRVEQLQDISDEDCIKEGIERSNDVYTFKNSPCGLYISPREAYLSLINRISGKATWKQNPYVFVYEFKLVK